LKITIQKAKNGEDTATADGHFLHSNYSPVKEAQRFVENLKLPYIPSSIIITEPGLSYIIPFIKERFAGVRIGAIRYTQDFSTYNTDFDFVLNYFEHKDFEAYLENTLNEEELLTYSFISWPASASIFEEEDRIVWNAIKAAMLRAKTLLITRQYFEKKWFLNSCNFLKYTKNTISFDGPVNKEVLIISSGPSLNPFIRTIKENQEKFFIICLSSAISVCLKNGIKPDLCMTTDGGYWAGQHLKSLYNNSIPLAMPAEGYCPKKLLSSLQILPLDYGDGLSSELIKSQKIVTKKALRNGTVSGTALFFATNYFTKNVYLCGMDMANQKGFQHAQPNQLEANNAKADNRIRNKLTRLSRAELTKGSLDIYKDWFVNNPLNTGNKKVCRLIEEKDRKNSLDWIADINLKTFENEILNIKDSEIFNYIETNYSFDHDAIKIFENQSSVEKWKKQLFPLDFVQLSHNPSNTEVSKKIEKEWDTLKKSAEKIFL
jgi:hypothetical protein